MALSMPDHAGEEVNRGLVFRRSLLDQTAVVYL
jgi:hypothetical protein